MARLFDLGRTPEDTLLNATYFCNNLLWTSNNDLKYYLQVMKHCAIRMEGIEMLTCAPNAL